MGERQIISFIALTAALIGAPCVTAASQSENPAGGQAAACVGVVIADVQGVEGSSTEVGRAVRDVFASYLTGPSIRVELLEARLAGQAAEEARQKNCSFVLTTSLTRKRGGGFGLGKMLGRTGTNVAWGLPVGGVTGAVVRGAASAGAQAVTELASSTRSRDEMRLDYRLSSPSGPTPILQKEEKQKATADGEDLITPMVQKAAEAIAAAVVR